MLLALFVGLVAAAAPVKVVATVGSLCAVAKPIVGPHGVVTCLATATQDPHFVDARPSLALDLARADLLVHSGLELEAAWLPVLLTGSRNAKVQPGAAGNLDASSVVKRLGVPAGPIDRSLGDLHGGGNPHYHVDPRAMRSVAVAVGERLATIDPPNAAAYRKAATDFVVDLDARIAVWQARAAPLRGVNVVGFHRSWLYLEDWLGFHIVADIEPKPGIPPTPKHLLHVVQIVGEQQVKLVLQESWFPATVSRTVAEKSGAPLVVVRAQADAAAGETYPQHIDALLGALLAPVAR